MLLSEQLLMLEQLWTSEVEWTWGVGDPSHPAKISASVTPLTSPRVQIRILLDLNTITSFAVIGFWVDQLLMTLVTYTSFSALAPRGG